MSPPLTGLRRSEPCRAGRRSVWALHYSVLREWPDRARLRWVGDRRVARRASAERRPAASTPSSSGGPLVRRFARVVRPALVAP